MSIGKKDIKCRKWQRRNEGSMKGLLIKDFFCLKKQLINYGFVIVGVIAVSVLFVLSYNFGNIHVQFQELIASGESTEAGVTMIAGNAMLLFMLIPIACTGILRIWSRMMKRHPFIKSLPSCPFPLADGWRADSWQGICFFS